jgi:hypothetical protein
VLRVEADRADDRFDVAYEPERLSPEVILATVRALGYEPALVARSERAAPKQRVDASKLPAELQAAFARSRQTGVPLLFDFFAPD